MKFLNNKLYLMLIIVLQSLTAFAMQQMNPAAVHSKTQNTAAKHQHENPAPAFASTGFCRNIDSTPAVAVANSQSTLDKLIAAFAFRARDPRSAQPAKGLSRLAVSNVTRLSLQRSTQSPAAAAAGAGRGAIDLKVAKEQAQQTTDTELKAAASKQEAQALKAKPQKTPTAKAIAAAAEMQPAKRKLAQVKRTPKKTKVESEESEDDSDFKEPSDSEEDEDDSENESPKAQKKTQKRNSKNDKTPVKCTWKGCEKTLSSKIAFEGHYRTHTGEKPFHCTLCDLKWALQTNTVRHFIRDHIIRKGNNPGAKVACKQCFTLKDEKLKAHVRAKHVDNQLKSK